MFKNPFSFKGRISRLEYIISLIVYFVIYYKLIPYVYIQTHSVDLWFLYIPLLWFLLAQSVKRCHDGGYSGFYLLIPFFPLWILFAKDDTYANYYGLNPKLINKQNKENIEAENYEIKDNNSTKVSEDKNDSSKVYRKAMIKIQIIDTVFDWLEISFGFILIILFVELMRFINSFLKNYLGWSFLEEKDLIDITSWNLVWEKELKSLLIILLSILIFAVIGGAIYGLSNNFRKKLEGKTIIYLVEAGIIYLIYKLLLSDLSIF